MSTAIVVGGGIGGLATAVALGRRGWQVEVLERSPVFAEVGAGLSVWPNALRALDAMGLGDAVRERAVLSGPAGIRDSRGRWLSHLDSEPVAMIHRAELLDVLRAAVPAPALHSGVTVRSADPLGRVAHSDGELTADLIVGADGIRSAVRRTVWGDRPAPRYVGYSTWRMVTPPVQVGESCESWGRGERFGYAALPDGRIYCFAVANTRHDMGLAELRDRFGGWHEPIPELLAAASAEAVLHHDLYDLPPLSTYVRGKIALIGDAAHAMAPDLGQGACQALEDAVILAASVDVGGGLATYDERRRRRTQRIAARARRTGAVAQWSMPPAVAVRNTILRLSPRSALSRSLAPIVGWTPDPLN